MTPAVGSEKIRQKYLVPTINLIVIGSTLVALGMVWISVPDPPIGIAIAILLFVLCISLPLTLLLYYSTWIEISEKGVDLHTLFENVSIRWEDVEGFDRRSVHRGFAWGLFAPKSGKGSSSSGDDLFIPLERFGSFWREFAWRNGRVGQAIRRYGPETIVRQMDTAASEKYKWGPISYLIAAVVIVIAVVILNRALMDLQVGPGNQPPPASAPAVENGPSLARDTMPCVDGPLPGTVIYFTENMPGSAAPGRIYRLQEGAVCFEFQRRNGDISSAAFGPNIVFIDHNRDTIHQIVDPESSANNGQVQTTRVLYDHNDYVRDVGYDPQGRLHFSDDKAVYRLEGRKAVPVTPKDFGHVGNFAFDLDGSLWVADGNFVPASIHRIIDGKPERVCLFEESVTGIAFESREDLVYSNKENRLVRVHLPNCQTEVLYTAAGKNWIWDVAVYQPELH